MEIYEPINDMIYWKYKYFPKTLADLEIDQYYINLISSWIKNYNKNKINKDNKNNNIKDNNIIDNNIIENIENIEIDDINDTDNKDEYISEKIINSPNKSCMILTGNHGIGKTSILITILKSLDFKIYQIN
jgi:DNA replication protein DnaC